MCKIFNTYKNLSVSSRNWQIPNLFGIFKANIYHCTRIASGMEWHSVILLTFLMNHILHLTSLWWIQTLYLFFFKISFFCRDKSCLNLTLPLNTHRYQLPPNVPWLLRFYCRWKAVVSTFSPPGGYSCSSLTLHCQPPPSVPTWGRGVKFCLEGDGSSGQIWRRWQTKLGFGHHHNFPHLSWHPTLPTPDIRRWKK